MSRDFNVSEGFDRIEENIENALRDLDVIRGEMSVIRTGEELESLERRIVEATDRLAGALIAKKMHDASKSKEF